MIDPLSDSGQLIIDINDARSAGNIDQFTLARLRQRTKNLKAVSAHESYVIDGILDALEEKMELAHSSFRKAFNLDPSSWFAHVNYAVTLKNTGLYHEAIDHADKAIRYATSEGERREAHETLQSALATGLRIKGLANTDPQGSLEGISRFMDQEGISDDDLSIFAEALLPVMKMCPSPPLFSLLHGEDETDTLYIQASVLTDPEKAAELSFELAMWLAQAEIPAYVNRAVTVGITACR